MYGVIGMLVYGEIDDGVFEVVLVFVEFGFEVCEESQGVGVVVGKVDEYFVFVGEFYFVGVGFYYGVGGRVCYLVIVGQIDFVVVVYVENCCREKFYGDGDCSVLVLVWLWFVMVLVFGWVVVLILV